MLTKIRCVPTRRTIKGESLYNREYAVNLDRRLFCQMQEHPKGHKYRVRPRSPLGNGAGQKRWPSLVRPTTFNLPRQMLGQEKRHGTFGTAGNDGGLRWTGL